MRRYSAEYWRYRAEEIRAIRDTMSSNEVRRIMTSLIRDYDLLYNVVLRESGPMPQVQVIEALMSAPFSTATRRRKSKE
jgi:hypothetical protein